MKVINEDTTFVGLITFLNIPRINTDTLKNVATPLVSGRLVFKASGAVISITNFLDGVDGQSITIIGDGTTTIVNNANIITNTGANRLLTANHVYRLTYLKSTQKWYMDD